MIYRTICEAKCMSKMAEKVVTRLILVSNQIMGQDTCTDFKNIMKKPEQMNFRAYRDYIFIPSAKESLQRSLAPSGLHCFCVLSFPQSNLQVVT